MKTGNATYVYCLVAAPKRPSLTRVPSGLPGTGPVRILDVEPGRYLVVADAPLSRYGEDAIRRGLADLAWVSQAAVAHEAVVETFIDANAVLPMKLFTLFASDERALAHLHTDRRRIDALVKRLGNHYEWGVRLLLDLPSSDSRPRRMRETRRKNAAAVRVDARGRRSAVRAKQGQLAGLAYLEEKKAQRDLARERAKRSREIVAELYDRLAWQSRAAKRRSARELPVQGGPLLLDAAFLVARRRSQAFSALVRREARALGRQGYDLTVTGPWPPYSFVQESD